VSVEPAWSARPLPPARIDWRRGTLEMAFWTETGHDKEDLLQALADFLRPRKVQVAVDQGWRAWDLDVHAGLWAHVSVLTAAEYHGGGRRLLRVRCAPRPSLLARLVLAGLLATAAAVASGGSTRGAAVAVVAAAIGAAVIGRAVFAAARMLRHVVAIVADRLGLAAVSAPRAGG
jgi:hypothetical protein